MYPAKYTIVNPGNWDQTVRRAEGTPETAPQEGKKEERGEEGKDGGGDVEGDNIDQSSQNHDTDHESPSSTPSTPSSPVDSDGTDSGAPGPRTSFNPFNCDYPQVWRTGWEGPGFSVKTDKMERMSQERLDKLRRIQGACIPSTKTPNSDDFSFSKTYDKISSTSTRPALSVGQYWQILMSLPVSSNACARARLSPNHHRYNPPTELPLRPASSPISRTTTRRLARQRRRSAGQENQGSSLHKLDGKGRP
ncbi:hypothetical protein F4805DRAFT_451773 [Annulohypoxylon moriforme]|nr:hypothetical protein F4805DRAFT_451773 [Annulohypoxylon moriforme]